MTENQKISAIYSFLALSMRYPEPEWLENDYLARLINLLENLEWLDDTAGLKNFKPQDSQAFEDLQVEHTRLFITAAGGVFAPPYGSVYLDESGLLCSKATAEVEDFYRRSGFALANKDEAADHIVNELEFLALLTAHDMEDGEKEFLERYFLPWFGQFHDKVGEAANLPFYPVIVRLISFFTNP
ncbi:MAG: hypothetical protein GXP59_03510 [Deltaproteobacteria bacterium]|nr:hypothetical protein [Deltaproteobacteria bacterium]